MTIKLDGLSQDEINAVIAIKENNQSLSWKEAAQMLHDGEAIMLYDCDDMEDVARYYAEEYGICNLDEIGPLADYIDYEAFGRLLSIDRTFLFIDNSICVEIWG